ncbi:MAG: NIPSNAP family protein [Gemmatirosa sp.]
MILVRDVFQLRFGAAREAMTLWREGLAFVKRSGVARDVRLLTDLAGPYYTLVLESTYGSLSEYEHELHDTTDDGTWRAWYARFVPLVQAGHREIFNVVGSDVPALPRSASRVSERMPDAVRLD